MTLDELQAQLNLHDNGILRRGSHQPGREFCALEFESKVRGREWTDAPLTLPDLRPLNDGLWSSDITRTKALLPVMVALWGWSYWTEAQRQEWSELVVIATINQLIAELPFLPKNVSIACRDARTLDAAASAAWSAAASAAWSTTSAAESAAASAASAASAADRILTLSCQIWINAAHQVERTTA